MNKKRYKLCFGLTPWIMPLHGFEFECVVEVVRIWNMTFENTYDCIIYYSPYCDYKRSYTDEIFINTKTSMIMGNSKNSVKNLKPRSKQKLSRQHILEYMPNSMYAVNPEDKNKFRIKNRQRNMANRFNKRG